MGEANQEFKDMSPEKAKDAILRQGELVRAGAKVNIGPTEVEDAEGQKTTMDMRGRVEVTGEQLDAARVDMVTDQLKIRARELIKIPEGVDPKAVIAELMKSNDDTDRALREFLGKIHGVKGGAQ